MQLIGINGFKTAGKDTAYDIITRIEDDRGRSGDPDERFAARRVARAGFADKLKIMAAKALGFVDLDDEECIRMMNECKESWDFSVYTGEFNGDIKFGFNGRQYLQWFGGEARKVFGDTFWIDQVLPIPSVPGYNDGLLEKRYPDTEMLVITDVRYPNEAERVHACGGTVWEIVRPSLESDGHDSEVPLPRNLVDLTIVNGGTIEQLAQKIRAVL